MSSIEEYADKFSEAADNWDLEKLCADLEKAKQRMSGFEPGGRKKKLTNLETACLRGLLCGHSPDEIAKELNREARGLRVELSRGLYRYLEIMTDRDPNSIKNWRDIAKWLEEAGYKKPRSRKDWGDAPDVSCFYGRTQEMATLQQWILKDCCRVAAILGIGGIGKTALSVKVALEVGDEFDYIIWRSLTNGTLAQDFTDISFFQNNRCLLILDGWEAILQGGDLVGNYLPGYESYSELLKKLAEFPHQSCLLLTSREKPREIATLEGPKLPVRSLELTGLQVTDAKEIFREKGLSEENLWERLITSYSGNPLALKMIAGTIQNFPFNGNLSEFLKYTTPFLGDIEYLIYEQFKRLSELEKKIMRWLASRSQPVDFSNLRDKIPIATSRREELANALTSLGRRSLIEKVQQGEKTLFALQPVVRKYIIKNTPSNGENTEN